MISGTPTTAGPVSVSATVADSANPSNTASKTLSFNINSGISITTASLPDGAVGKPYSQTLTVAGGTGTYTWSGPISGAGSAGLTFAGGVVSGTPTATGPVTVAASVSDTASPANTASKTLNFTVYPALAISTTSLPSAMVGVAYDQALTASGGTGSYTWSGNLTGTGAAGLSLTAGGHVTGTPTTAGSVSVSASVSDTANPPNVASANLPLTVNPPTLTITTSGLPNGAVGTPYSQTLAASGGTPPYTWSGTPPAGLTLAGNGAISGTPTTVGTYTVNIQVTDAQSRTANRALALRIFAAVSLASCPAPNGFIGQPYSSTATASGGATPYTWSIASGLLPAGIQLNQANGLFAGTPQLIGSFTFTVLATDPTGSSATRRCSIAITAPLSIPTPSLADAVVGTLYQQTLTAAGGKPPYTWSVVSGALPPGLSLNASAGVISGTPTSTGQYPFRLSVTDSNLVEAEADTTLIVVSGLAITACPTPTGAVGENYSSGFSAAGGPTPFSWSLSAGAPPAGLTLDSSGTLKGTPTTAGTSTFTAKVTDQSRATATRQCSIAISTALTISTTTLPPGNLGVAYSVSLAATGGTPPYAWSLPAGALPPGLSLNQGTGQITGTPTNGGSFGFTARVTDAGGTSQDAQLTIGVTATFAVAACPTPAATIGVPYASTLNAVSGQSPYGWSLATGNLPDGLVLNGSTGVITGTPTTAGTASFTVAAKDASGAVADRACNISVIAANLSITTGADLPQTAIGVPYTQTLAASGGQQPYTWSLVDGTLPAGLQLSAGGVLAGTPSQAGAYTFTIRVVDAVQNLSQEVFRLTVTPAAVPTISYSGVPDIAAPAQQISPGVQIQSAYPVDITGTMTVSFTPDPGLVDDPAIQFAGGRTIGAVHDSRRPDAGGLRQWRERTADRHGCRNSATQGVHERGRC